MKSKILAASMLLALALPFAAAAPVYASPSSSKAAACDGIGLTGAECNGNAANGQVQSTIGKIVNIISLFVGAIAVVMVIVSGFKYVTSGGDANKVSSAKTSLTYAIIGLVVVALAQFMVHFVLKNVPS